MQAAFAVLAVDVGTTSTRAALFDDEGRPAGPVAQVPSGLRTARDGTAVIDADTLVANVVAAIDQALDATPAGAVHGVGLSCFWHSLVGVDARERPTTPVITWADRRAGAVAAAQRAEGALDALRQQTGAPAHSSFWSAKIPWLAANQPDVHAATVGWRSAADLLSQAFFGRVLGSVSMASATGLFDQRSLDWNEDAIRLAGVQRRCLPVVRDEAERGLLPAFARRWPRLAAVPWFPSVGDGACSNLGVGGIDGRTLVLMLGTSGALRQVRRADAPPPLAPGQWCYRVDARRLATGMAMSEGGASAAWVREHVAGGAPVDEAALDAMRADSHGLTVLPYVLGARSPDWQDGRTACIAGIDASTTSAQVQRAMLESVGLRIADLKRMLDAATGRPERVVVTGGALTRSRTWRQIVADCIGQDVRVSVHDEASLRGAALFAIEGLGVRRLEDASFDFADHLPFDPGSHAVYREALARQTRLDRALRAAGF